MRSTCMHLGFQWAMKTMPHGTYKTSCSPSHVHQYLLLSKVRSFQNLCLYVTETKVWNDFYEKHFQKIMRAVACIT